MQRAAGLYGSLIVDVADGQREPFHYDGELNLLLSDWYHQDVNTQAVGLSSYPFRWIGEPQVSHRSHPSLHLKWRNDSSKAKVLSPAVKKGRLLPHRSRIKLLIS